MGEQTSGTTTIRASAAEVMEALTDFESYPTWTGFTSAEVLRRDRRGRGKEVRFEMSAPVIGDVTMTFSYEYLPDDGGLSWISTEIEGNIERITGEYLLRELDERETKVTYTTSVDLKFKVPGLVRRQGEKLIVNQALEGLRRRVEAE